MSGNVYILPSCSLNDSILASHLLMAIGCVHLYTCCASLGLLHCGHSSVGRNFHYLAIFPTEHGSDTCFVTQCCLVSESIFITSPIASQSKCACSINGVLLSVNPVFVNFWIVYMLVHFLRIGNTNLCLFFQKDHGSCAICWAACSLHLLLYSQFSFTKQSTWTFIVAYLSNGPTKSS